jgi:hypothetical protein
MRLRLEDLTQEGVWGELVYTSIGMWMHSMRDPLLMLAGCQVINDWAIEFQRFSPRYVCTAMIPTLSVETAVAEVERTADMGFKIAMLPTSPTIDGPNWNKDDWHRCGRCWPKPACTSGFRGQRSPRGRHLQRHLPPGGGHLMNYYEASYHMQLAAAKLVASGVFERHPTLKCVVSEAAPPGCRSWPTASTRPTANVNQVWPKFSRLQPVPLRERYARRSNDRSAPQASGGDGLQNVCWGSDYPHLEGTFGHTRRRSAASSPT